MSSRISLITVVLSAVLGLISAGCRSLDGSAPETNFRRTGARSLPSAQRLLPVQHDAAGRLQQAVGHYKHGNLTKAKELVRSAQRIDPYLASSYDTEARIALDLNDRDGYVASLRAMLAAEPQSASRQNATGLRLMQVGERDAGLAALRKAVALQPSHPVYARDLAGAYVASGRLTAAEAALAESHRLNPDDETLPAALARLHESTANWPAAVAAYQQLLREHPNSPRWRTQLARCLYRMGDHEAAHRAFVAYIPQAMEAVSLAEYVEYADACMQTGDFASADEVLEQIAEIHADRFKELELLRALCALRQGDTARAEMLLDTALVRWPSDKTLREVRRRIQPVQSAKWIPHRSWRPVGH